LALGSHGTSTSLPNSYEEVAGLFAVGLLIVILSVFGSFVVTKFKEAQGKPHVRVGIVLGAVALLGLAGRGVQILALKNTYGSMLAYYATDGDLEDVRSELAKKPPKEHLDEAVSRAAQYNNDPALKLLLDAGADFGQSTVPEERRHCLLVGRRPEFIKAALDHGVRQNSYPGCEFAVYETVWRGENDADVEKNVKLLLSAGFSAMDKPAFASENPLELANKQKWPLTAAALRVPTQ